MFTVQVPSRAWNWGKSTKQNKKTVNQKNKNHNQQKLKYRNEVALKIASVIPDKSLSASYFLKVEDDFRLILLPPVVYRCWASSRYQVYFLETSRGKKLCNVLCNYGKMSLFSTPSFISFNVMLGLSMLAVEQMVWSLYPLGDLRERPLEFCPESSPQATHLCSWVCGPEIKINDNELCVNSFLCLWSNLPAWDFFFFSA